MKHLRYYTAEPPSVVGVRFFCGEFLPAAAWRHTTTGYTAAPEDADCEKCLARWRKVNGE